MTKPPVIDGPQVSLQSKDHEELLDIIDHLRAQGISRYIDLPQLIVCGDQSSGKSSVLEAVSGLRFPTKDNLCTRFATELILRRGHESSVAITIVPGDQRTEEEVQKLQAFKTPTTALEDFATITNAAEKAMGLNQNAKVFSSDILRVEITGPKQPHLTLVDLPGLFHAGNKAQTEKDASSVKSLVLSYMEKPRSIILAVVSAKNDYANQIVTKYARDLDKVGNRTLGIITKPDTLHPGSDSERSFLELAENKDVNFRLGWHVLKNRDYDTRDCTAEERDRAEEEFFSHGIWTTLRPSHMGIGSLKPRLSRVLRDQILSELPSLIQDVEAGIDECKGRLERLGGARANMQEQRLYLLRVSQAFSYFVKSAVDGVYVDPFFGDSTTEGGYGKRLRAVVQNTLLDFANEMRVNGHASKYVDTLNENNGTEGQDKNKRRNRRQQEVLRTTAIEKVETLMKRTRGRELPGTFNPQIIGELFYQHSAPWKTIIIAYANKILDAARACLNLVLDHTADQQTSDGLLRYIVNPAMESVKESLENSVAAIMKNHHRGHPITYNHYFTENVQKAREEHRKKILSKRLHSYFGVTPEQSRVNINRNVTVAALLENLCAQTEAEMDKFACSEALDCMEAYYKVAMKFLVDDFGVHTVEEHLLDGLPGIFTPELVLGLDEEMIENIAAETEESKAERASSTKKLNILEQTLSILHRLDRHKPTSALDKRAELYEVRQKRSGLKRSRDEELEGAQAALARESKTAKLDLNHLQPVSKTSTGVHTLFGVGTGVGGGFSGGKSSTS